MKSWQLYVISVDGYDYLKHRIQETLRLKDKCDIRAASYLLSDLAFYESPVAVQFLPRDDDFSVHPSFHKGGPITSFVTASGLVLGWVGGQLTNYGRDVSVNQHRYISQLDCIHEMEEGDVKDEPILWDEIEMEATNYFERDELKYPFSYHPITRNNQVIFGKNYGQMHFHLPLWEIMHEQKCLRGQKTIEDARIEKDGLLMTVKCEYTRNWGKHRHEDCYQIRINGFLKVVELKELKRFHEYYD